MTLTERYKRLPEAHAVPESLCEVERILEEIVATQRQMQELQRDLEAATLKMMNVLRKDWTVDELRAVGLMSR